MRVKIAEFTPVVDRCNATYIFSIDSYSESETDYSDYFDVQNNVLYMIDDKPLENLGDIPIKIVMKDPTGKLDPVRKTYTLTVSCFNLENRRSDIIMEPTR